MLLACLSALAAETPPADPVPTWARPVPTAPTPQVPHYLERHRELQVQVSSARRASPVFREPWSQLEVHYALQAWSQEPLPLSVAQQERARDLATISATLATEALLNETIARSEFLSGVQLGLRTLTGPSVELRPGRSQRVVANGPPPNRVPDLQAARLDLPVKRNRKPSPSLRLGAGSSLRTDADALTLQPESLAWTGYLILRQIGVDDLRLNVDLVQLRFPGLGGSKRFGADPGLSWQLNVRKRLHPRATLSVELRSVSSTWYPKQARCSLNLTPYDADPRWVLRAGVRYDFPSPKATASLTPELALQWNGPWRAPNDPSRWPLGAQVGKPEAWWTG